MSYIYNVFITMMIMLNSSLFITPYRQPKNTYYTHTMNAIYTIKNEKTNKKET